jgi:acyl-CoA reductase-like NAD-dependent aldehyde dehydrogenase
MPAPFATDGSYVLLDERRPAVDGQTLDVVSPIDGSLVGRVHEFTPQEIDSVFAAAVRHQGGWRNRSFDERTRILMNVADHLEGAVEPSASSS